MAVVSERSPRIDTTLRRHPLGTRARILLCSVFGPYARDDEYGSRALNPMELYHNQVTRVQGPFSLRMFHRSWGIMLIQANVAAPCAVFDFPTRDRFIEELRERQYDIVGITSIISNQAKVKAMCDLVREYQPRATIVVGGPLPTFQTSPTGLTRTISSVVKVCGGSANTLANPQTAPYGIR